MTGEVYRYRFAGPLPFADVLETLDLAVIACEALYGESRARLDARYTSDAALRVIVIDASTPTGQSLNQLFTGFLRREYREGTFGVERVDRKPAASPAATGT